jgi:hypothetical protein
MELGSVSQNKTASNYFIGFIATISEQVVFNLPQFMISLAPDPDDINNSLEQKIRHKDP